MTIKSVCALFQQKKMTVENKVRSLTSLTSSHSGFSATAVIDDLEDAILNRQGKERIILASQPRLVPKEPVKQLQGVLVPQVELREPAISVRAVIIASFQLLKIDFLKLFCHGDGFHHCEVLLVTEKSAEATFMSHVNRSNVHCVWPKKRHSNTQWRLNLKLTQTIKQVPQQ